MGEPKGLKAARRWRHKNRGSKYSNTLVGMGEQPVVGGLLCKGLVVGWASKHGLRP